MLNTKLKKLRKNFGFFPILITLFIFGTAILFVLYPKSQEVKLETNNEGVGIGNSAANKVDEFLEDFPIYQGSILVTTAESDDGVGKSFIWETDDETGLIYEYLKSELRIKGWTLSDESSMGGSYAISFEKDGVEGFLGVFVGAGGKSVVSVSIRE